MAENTRIARLRRVKSRAGAVVIGGGVGGCSIAYHLAKLGVKDVVLVEQFDLTYGSTWHSAGLVGQLRSSVSLTRMMMYSVELYAALRRETGKDPGWHELGGIRLASSRERLEEIQRQAGWAKTFGLPLEVISAAEAQERFPLMSTRGVLGAAFLPRDGYLDPSQLTFALADGARHYGAEISTRTRVTAIERDARGRVCRVVTDRGEIETEVVVDAAGMAAPDVAKLVGVTVPIIPMAHQYLITEPFEPALAALPTLRDPDNLVYWRTEVGGLVMGGYERDPSPFGLDGIPPGFEAQLLTWDYERFEELMEGSIRRVPAMEEAQVKKFFNGPEAFTPDGEFILGESEVPGFWVAAGFCAHGLAGAGGIGKVMAEWIAEGQPEWDLWHMDIRRFGRQYRSQSFTLQRTIEVYSTYYDIKYPGEERLAGRPLRVSPAYARHTRDGASFGEKSGWERVNWFDVNIPAGHDDLRPRGWAGQALVACDRGRVHRSGRAGRADRPVVVREARRPRARRVRVPRPDVRELGRQSARLGHLHAAPERARRHRGRRHAGAARPGPLPVRHGHRLRLAQPVVAAQAPARRRVRVRRRHQLGADLLLPLGSPCARHPAAADEERSLQRGVPLHAGA